MSVSTKDGAKRKDVRSVVFNLPNVLTWLRLGIAVVLFCTLAYERYLVSFILFLIAAGTDWLDGYIARKWEQITQLGRIIDPFADKTIICGTFIFLAANPASQIRPWMAVVVVGRELLVTALRSFIEQRGGDFSAKLAGKLKMVLQCVAASVCMFYLHYFVGPSGEAAADAAWIYWLLIVSVWSAVLLTVLSGIEYIYAAVRMLRT